MDLTPEAPTTLPKDFLRAGEEDSIHGLTAELIGARLVCWRAHRPLTVLDSPAAKVDSARIQDLCPFSAHTRKTNPRVDLVALGFSAVTGNRHVIRRSIEFMPQVSAER
ncbi:hypothetical protein V8D89_010014 [Ganoderma adspersum]